MSEELGTTPGADTGSQGQVADSGANQGPIDFSKTPDGQRFMSAVQVAGQKEANEERAARIAAQKQIDELKRQNEQMMAQWDAVMGTVQRSDQNAYDELIQAAKLADKDVELKQAKEQLEEIKRRQEEALAEQQAYREASAYWNNVANDLGLNPSDPEYQAAVQQTLATGNTIFAHQALASLSRKQAVPQPADTPESDFIMPSGSGAPGPRRLTDAEKEKRYGELYELMRNPTQNKAQIAAMKKELEQ